MIVANHSLGGNAIINMAVTDPSVPVNIPSLSVGFGTGNHAQGPTPEPGGQRHAAVECSRRGLLVPLARRARTPRPSAAPSATCGHPPASALRARCRTRSTSAPRATTAECTPTPACPTTASRCIVDGGTYNGQTVVGLGLTKASHIYYRAMTVYQRPTSDFVDHADALEASCADLVGLPLTNPDGTPSVDVITPERLRRRSQAPLPPSSCAHRRPSAASSPCWPRTRPTVARRERARPTCTPTTSRLSPSTGRSRTRPWCPPTSPRVTGSGPTACPTATARPCSASTSRVAPAPPAATSPGCSTCSAPRSPSRWARPTLGSPSTTGCPRRPAGTAAT